jgi:cobalamin biosynthesis Co2+ chelatase CbiK
MIRLLKIKNDNNRTLEKVRSDLTTATEEAKQILMTYCETSHKPIYQSNVSIDSAISCQKGQ